MVFCLHLLVLIVSFLVIKNHFSRVRGLHQCGCHMLDSLRTTTLANSTSLTNNITEPIQLEETLQLCSRPLESAGKHMLCTVGFASAKRCLIAAAVVNKHPLIRVHRRPEEVSQQRLYPKFTHNLSRALATSISICLG